MFEKIKNKIKRYIYLMRAYFYIYYIKYRIHLADGYALWAVDKLDTENMSSVASTLKLDSEEVLNQVVMFTHPYEDQIGGMVVINVKALLTSIDTFRKEEGFIESFRALNFIIDHESRHSYQFNYLFNIGGDKLINKVFDTEQGKDYYDNILEKDANDYASGEIVSLQERFKEYTTI